MKKVLSVLLALVMMLSLSVVAFADGDVAEVNGVSFPTLQEAIDAAGAGDTVTLLKDIVVASDLNNAAHGLFNIAADDDIVIDLGGHTIDVTDNSPGNFIVFYNYGTMEIKNGTVQITSTIDREWNAESAVILNRGGVLTITSGNYIHNGGTDMAFSVDNSGNSYGDAYLYVNGGTLQSTYIAVRMRMADTTQNGNPGNGSVYMEVTGGEIIGTSRGIWGQITNPAPDASDYLGNLEISGGSVSGNAAIQMGSDNYDNIDVEITGEAEIIGSVVGDESDFKDSISGGTFSETPDEKFMSNGSTIIVGNDVVTKADDGTVSSECAHNGDWEWVCNEDINEDTHVKRCLVCGKFFGDEEPHEFGEWTVTKEPTKIHKGERVRVCDVCDYEEVETLSRVSGEDEGHLVIPESQKPAEDKDTGKANPATGSTEFVNVAIALGTVSLAAAAAVVLKK